MTAKFDAFCSRRDESGPGMTPAQKACVIPPRWRQYPNVRLEKIVSNSASGKAAISPLAIGRVQTTFAIQARSGGTPTTATPLVSVVTRCSGVMAMERLCTETVAPASGAP